MLTRRDKDAAWRLLKNCLLYIHDASRRDFIVRVTRVMDDRNLAREDREEFCRLSGLFVPPEPA